MLITKYYLNDEFYCGSITYAHKTRKINKKDFKKRHSISFGSKRQAFAKASRLLFFNPDLCHFATLTYSTKTYSYSKCYKDFKNFVYKERLTNPNFKYIAVVEFHKDKSLHLHLICNNHKKNPKGSQHTVANWTHGYSSSWTIPQMTYFHRRNSHNNQRFNPLKYLFNYIKKSNDKIGGRWLLKSSNLTKPKKISVEADSHTCLRYRVHRQQEGAIFEKKYLNIWADDHQLYIYSYYKKPASRRKTACRREGTPSARDVKYVPQETYRVLSSQEVSSLLNCWKKCKINRNKLNKLNNKYKYEKQRIFRSGKRYFKKG